MKNGYELGFMDKYVGKERLGYIGLHTESPVLADVPLPKDVVDAAYFSDNPTRPWVNGILQPNEHHVTVRYGFLPNVEKGDIKRIAEVLGTPPNLRVLGWEIFESPYEDEPYECVVAKVHSSNLEKLHNTFGMLPNISTYPNYNPHVTVGYFNKGFWNEGIAELALRPFVGVLGWDFGNDNW